MRVAVPGLAYPEDMKDMPPQVVAGFPEMWTPVHNKYKLFFDCAAKLAPITSEMIRSPVQAGTARSDDERLQFSAMSSII